MALELEGVSEGITSLAEGVSLTGEGSLVADALLAEMVKDRSKENTIELRAGTSDVEDGAAEETGFGSGFSSPAVAGTTLFLIVKSACVTSRAAICWPRPDVPSHPPVYQRLPQVAPS